VRQSHRTEGAALDQHAVYLLLGLTRSYPAHSHGMTRSRLKAEVEHGMPQLAHRGHRVTQVNRGAAPSRPSSTPVQVAVGRLGIEPRTRGLKAGDDDFWAPGDVCW
jgi:hypothetical protein